MQDPEKPEKPKTDIEMITGWIAQNQWQAAVGGFALAVALIATCSFFAARAPDRSGEEPYIAPTFERPAAWDATPDPSEKSWDPPVRPTAAPRVEPKNVSEVKDLLVAGIKASPAVLDAAVTQEGRQVSLVLIVAGIVGEGEARLLGDDFVRMAKSILSDGKVGKDGPGRGEYNYLIGVYYVNEEQVALGAKSASAEQIRW